VCKEILAKRLLGIKETIPDDLLDYVRGVERIIFEEFLFSLFCIPYLPIFWYGRLVAFVKFMVKNTLMRLISRY